MSCCGGWDDGIYDHNCPECGEELDKDGEPIEGCSYSPVICKACGARPCDQSC